MQKELEFEEDDLYIPKNVPPGKWVITGYRSQEITKIIIAFICALVMALILFAITNNILISFFCLAIITGGTFGAVGRDSHNENLIDKIKIILEYIKTQKRYLYEYYNIYEGEVISGRKE